jgi:L-histidine N-alpha-methyltransferase
VIDVIARELDATDLRGDDFDHVARWNEASSRIEMWLRARRDVTTRFRSIALDWRLPAGGELRTEISVKFRREQMEQELATAGFDVRHLWTDAHGDFSLTLATAAPDEATGR